MSCSVNPTVVANSLRDPLAHFLEVSSKSDRLAKFALPLKTGSSGWFRKENEALLSVVFGGYLCLFGYSLALLAQYVIGFWSNIEGIGDH